VSYHFITGAKVRRNFYFQGKEVHYIPFTASAILQKTPFNVLLGRISIQKLIVLLFGQLEKVTL